MRMDDISRRHLLGIAGLAGLAPMSFDGPHGDAGGHGGPDATEAPGPGQPAARSEQTQVITGRFEPGAPDWAYLPVEIPRGVREISVRYEYNRPTAGPNQQPNVLDIGCFDPRGHGLGEAAGFRGYSGGARDSFTISAGAATPGYLPGPILPGSWQILLGPYTVHPSGLDYRVEVTVRYGRPERPFRPDPAPTRATGRGRAWYRGDLHTHTVHSDGKRTPEQLAAAARGRGLDFLVSSEHNTVSAHGVWGAPAGTDLLVLAGEEITTRDGHCVAAGLRPGQWIDWRYRAADQEFARFQRQVHAAGGLLIAAHPYCPFVGCSWKFGYDGIDAVEVWNGPWTLDDDYAVRLWDSMLRQGRRLAAVGSSDCHSLENVVGLPMTAVRADGLDREAILAGVRGGHAYVSESAQVGMDLTARVVPGSDSRAPGVGIGQELRVEAGDTVAVTLTVTGVPGTVVRLLTEAGVVAERKVPADTSGPVELVWRSAFTTSGFVRAEVRRPVATETTPDTMVALCNPVHVRVG